MNEGSIREMLNNLKKPNMCIIGVTEGEKSKGGQIKHLK